MKKLPVFTELKSLSVELWSDAGRLRYRALSDALAPGISGRSK